jgi:hypothetical protein
MNIQEKARQQLAKERIEEDVLEDKLLTRSEKQLGAGEGETAKAREILTQERQEQENRQEAMLNRSIEQIQIQ